MTGQVISIWRHPIKSHGREELTSTTVSPGGTLPGDRVWAVAHEHSRAQGPDWAPCANFSRAAKAPELMAITARLDDKTGLVTLSHPDRDDITVDPDRDQARLLDWVSPLMPPDRAASARIIRASGRGFTDSDFPSITLCNMASHKAVEDKAGQPLSIHRWRGNIWLGNLPAWEEFNWIGRDVQIGSAVFHIRERTDRCMATAANPETGKRDINLLDILSDWDHQDFSVRAEVIREGTLQVDSSVQVL